MKNQTDLFVKKPKNPRIFYMHLLPEALKVPILIFFSIWIAQHDQYRWWLAYGFVVYPLPHYTK